MALMALNALTISRSAAVLKTSRSNVQMRAAPDYSSVPTIHALCTSHLNLRPLPLFLSHAWNALTTNLKSEIRRRAECADSAGRAALLHCPILRSCKVANEPAMASGPPLHSTHRNFSFPLSNFCPLARRTERRRLVLELLPKANNSTPNPFAAIRRIAGH